jgi:hypothetical protein
MRPFDVLLALAEAGHSFALTFDAAITDGQPAGWSLTLANQNLASGHATPWEAIGAALLAAYIQGERE